MGAILDDTKLRRVLARMLDEKEFFSTFGIRALLRIHAEHPYVFNLVGHDHSVGYVAGESDTGMFGGNSNWRGPIAAVVEIEPPKVRRQTTLRVEMKAP
jgi:hypothetical protein